MTNVDKGKTPRITVTPLLMKEVGDMKPAERALYLDALVEKAHLYDEMSEQQQQPSIGSSTSAALARLTSVTADLVSVQNASLGLIMERYDQVIEAHKVTRGLIGSMRTDDDERAVVMDKMEHVFEIQQQRLEEMTDRLKRTAKRRDPVKDIWAEEPLPTRGNEEERGDHDETGGRER